MGCGLFSEFTVLCPSLYSAVQCLCFKRLKAPVIPHLKRRKLKKIDLFRIQLSFLCKEFSDGSQGSFHCNCFPHICLVFWATYDWVKQFGILLLNSCILIKISLQSHFKRTKALRSVTDIFTSHQRCCLSKFQLLPSGCWEARHLPDMPAAWI